MGNREYFSIRIVIMVFHQDKKDCLWQLVFVRKKCKANEFTSDYLQNSPIEQINLWYKSSIFLNFHDLLPWRKSTFKELSYWYDLKLEKKGIVPTNMIMMEKIVEWINNWIVIYGINLLRWKSWWNFWCNSWFGWVLGNFWHWNNNSSHFIVIKKSSQRKKLNKDKSTRDYL